MTAAIPGERQPVAVWWAMAAAGTAAAVASAWLGLTAVADGGSGASARVDAQSLTDAAGVPLLAATTVPPTAPSTVPTTLAPLAASAAASPVDCPPVFEVQFGRDSAAFDRDGIRSQAPALVAWLAAHPDTTMVVDGYADASGDPGSNLKLSYERATAVVAELAGAGMPADRMEARGFGEYQPVVGEAADSGRNRRVTTAVPGYEGCPLAATLGGEP